MKITIEKLSRGWLIEWEFSATQTIPMQKGREAFSTYDAMMTRALELMKQ